MGVPIEVTEAALNHIGSRAGIKGVYQTWSYDSALAEWYPKWEQRLQQIIKIEYSVAA